jgi:hypothetical protein
MSTAGSGPKQDPIRVAAPARRQWLEVCRSRDAKVPLGSDDWEMECGWRSVPVPPTSEPDSGWFLIDSSDDRSSIWARWRIEGGT